MEIVLFIFEYKSVTFTQKTPPPQSTINFPLPRGNFLEDEKEIDLSEAI